MKRTEDRIVTTAKDVNNHTLITHPYLLQDNSYNQLTTKDRSAFLDNQADAHE